MTPLEQINSTIKQNFHHWVEQLIPGGKMRGDEYVVKNPTRGDDKPGSFSINLRTCLWADFATDSKGNDPISLYAYVNGIDNRESFKRLAEQFLPDRKATMRAALVTIAKDLAERPEATQLITVPAGIEPPDRAPLWTYRYPTGQIAFCVQRVEIDGGKRMIPWTYWSDGTWKCKGLATKRPLLGGHNLAGNEKPVLVVEGEKTYDAAVALFPDWVVVTWANGTKSIGKTDWQPIRGRRVVIWPDNDDAGFEAAERIRDILRGGAGVVAAHWHNLPAKWDLADLGDDKQWAIDAVNSTEIPNAEPGMSHVEIVDGYFPDESDSGKRLGTIENTQELLRRLGVSIRFNEVSKRDEITLPGLTPSVANETNVCLAHLRSWHKRCRLSTDDLKSFLTAISDANAYNPICQWIESEPWDGVRRLDDFCDTVTVRNEVPGQNVWAMKHKFIRTWMISAIASAYQKRGVSAHGVLVFLGAQNLGKTMWFKKLLPDSMAAYRLDGAVLHTDNKDSVTTVISHWLVELGEVDATLRKSDMAHLKAFLTKDKDVLRRPYAEADSYYPRQTVFFASVNDSKFLMDPTGNRRFWTLECESINHAHTFDMQQVWAEVKATYDAGETWFLTQSEIQSLSEHNEQFTMVEPIQEMIASKYNWNASPILWVERTCTGIAEEMGILNPGSKHTRAVSRIMQSVYGQVQHKTRKAWYYKVPPKNDE